MAHQVEEARRQLLAAPAGPVVGQQALQFYELAALHLSQPEPRLEDAQIAIDALAAVVESLGSRARPGRDPAAPGARPAPPGLRRGGTWAHPGAPGATPTEG